MPWRSLIGENIDGEAKDEFVHFECRNCDSLMKNGKNDEIFVNIKTGEILLHDLDAEKPPAEENPFEIHIRMNYNSTKLTIARYFIVRVFILV